jgi:hypothetical protein
LSGLLNEAAALLQQGLLPSSNMAASAVGYRQAMEWLLQVCSSKISACLPACLPAFFDSFLFPTVCCSLVCQVILCAWQHVMELALVHI